MEEVKEESKKTTTVDDLLRELENETEGDARFQEEVKEKETGDSRPEDFEPQPPKPPAEEPFTSDKAMGTARTWVKWFNSAMKMFMPWLYRKSVLEEGDQERMGAWVRDQKRQGRSEREMEEAISSDSSMWPVKNRFDRYLKACEEVPLNAEEMEMIAEPLSQLIIKYKTLQLGPEWSLVIAVFIVMLPRFEPMLKNLGLSTDKAKP